MIEPTSTKTRLWLINAGDRFQYKGYDLICVEASEGLLHVIDAPGAEKPYQYGIVHTRRDSRDYPNEFADSVTVGYWNDEALAAYTARRRQRLGLDTRDMYETGSPVILTDRSDPNPRRAYWYIGSWADE